MDTESAKERIRTAGFRATTQRIALLQHLASLSAPQTVSEISDALRHDCDHVTAYRMIEAFMRAGLVREVNIKGDHPRYELADDDHHHLVCVACHRMEDFEGCDIEPIARAALRQSRQFASVTGHSFDLYGLCRSCAA